MTPTKHNYLLQLVAFLLLLPLVTPSVLQAQDYSDYDIYIYNSKSGTVRQATDLPDVGEFNPSFSPSGHAIVYDVVDFDKKIQDIWITNLRRGSSRPLPGAEGGNDPSWSPQGPLIAFDRDNGDDDYDRDPTLYYVRIGYATRHLIRENATDPDWAPNGRRVVFVDDNDGSIRTRQIYTGNETVITESGSNPVWSPNGDWIAFSDGTNIFKIAVAKRGIAIGSVVQVTNAMNDVYNDQPSWSPDSKEIYFHSYEWNPDNETSNIMKVSADGGDSEFVTGSDQPDYDPAAGASCWSTRVAYSGYTNPESLASSLDNYRLDQNYPNPFRSQTEIEFEIPYRDWVELFIYSESGKLVRRLVRKELDAGIHSVSWNGCNMYGRNASQGMYYYTLRSGDFKATKTIYKNE